MSLLKNKPLQMDFNELLELRKTKKAELEAIITKGEAEKRMLSDDELTNTSKIKLEISELDKQIEEKRAKETQIFTKKNTQEMDNFSLIRAIRNVAEGRNFDDATLQMLDFGKKDFANAGLSYRGQLALPIENLPEKRGEILAGTANAGKEIVREDMFDLIGALRNNLVMVKAGAQMLTGMVGDVTLPIYAGSNVNWQTETGAAADGAGAFSEITFSPKRLTAFVDVSKQFLIQDSVSANQLLINDLTNAIQEKLEATLFGVAAGSATQPAGLFNAPTYSFTGATTWYGVVGMESAVSTSNALTGNLAYIFHPSTLGVLKTTAKAANQALFIAENSLVNGYPYYVTAAMPTVNTDQKAAIFGNWNDFIICNWGGLDITVDPYSQSVAGKIRIVVNTYWDAKPRRAVSFSKAGLK